MELRRPRRVYLHKRVLARRLNSSLAPVWQAKQEAEPGTALPATFPYLAALTAVGYTTHEDLDGADADELSDYLQISVRDADVILAAFAAL